MSSPTDQEEEHLHQKEEEEEQKLIQQQQRNINNNNKDKEQQQQDEEDDDDEEEDPMAPPKMDRAIPDLPCPPFRPLIRDLLYINVPEWPYPLVGYVGCAGNNNSNNNNAPHSSDSGINHSTSSLPPPPHLQSNRNSFANMNMNMNGRHFSHHSDHTATTTDDQQQYSNQQQTSHLKEVLERFDPERSNAHKYPNADRLRKHFKDGGTLAVDDALWIITVAQSILIEEPNVLEVSTPVTICGDIHGQYYDLMTLFDLGGSPSPSSIDGTPGTQYLFMGDYVDRGSFSTEVTLLLLAYKIMYPTSFWLLRGNHECRHLTGYFNFKSECLKKYNEQIYDAFMNCFDCLPLAARVDYKFLCVHGGIGPDIKSVEDIALIHRVCEPPPRGPMCDLLWADPMEPDDESAAPGARYLYNDIRSCSYSFSYKAALEFLNANGLLSLIRAHESQFEGYRMFQKVPETGMPSVICVFSAPNYCDYNNKAAIMLLENHTMKIRQFAAVEHPYVLQNFLNAFSWSLPFLTDKIQQVASEMTGFSTEVVLPQIGGGSGIDAERQRENQRLVEQNRALSLTHQQMANNNNHNNNNNNNNGAESINNNSMTSTKNSTSAKKNGGGNSSTTQKRPLHGLLASVKQNADKLKESSTSSLQDVLHALHLHYHFPSFHLLPRFLRSRGRIVKIKIKAVVWFLRYRVRHSISSTTATSTCNNGVCERKEKNVENDNNNNAATATPATTTRNSSGQESSTSTDQQQHQKSKTQHQKSSSGTIADPPTEIADENDDDEKEQEEEQDVVSNNNVEKKQTSSEDKDDDEKKQPPKHVDPLEGAQEESEENNNNNNN